MSTLINVLRGELNSLLSATANTAFPPLHFAHDGLRVGSARGQHNNGTTPYPHSHAVTHEIHSTRQSMRRQKL